MFTGATLEDKSKDELVMHTSNMTSLAKDGEELPASTFANAKEDEDGPTEVEDPPRDPLVAPPTTSSSTFAPKDEPADYFATLLPTPDNSLDHQELHLAQPQPQTAAVSSLVAGSDALARGTFVTPTSTSSTPLDHRPEPRREPSTATVLSMHSVDSNVTVKEDSKDTSKKHGFPTYPDQTYAALQNQYHPTRPYPPLRQRSSHPTQVLSFAPSLHQSGSRTVGNSPATTPSVGLYSPKIAAVRDEWDNTQTPGTYASPYLHPTHRQAPKETHVADVDVDPISGRKLINHYEIMDELGRGTHGKVKLGRDLQTENTFVAIKIVERYSKRRRLGRLGNPEDKVKKEIAILKKARHPNIVALLEVIDDPSRKKVYIVLEWVERGTIHWRAKAEKEIAVLEAHRFERERSGIQTGETLAEDVAVRREVARRLNKRKQEIRRSWKQARQDRDPDRGIDHYGGGEDSEDDTLSRVSTTTNESSMYSAKRKQSTVSIPQTTLEGHHDGVATPTAEQPEMFLELTEHADTKRPAHTHEDLRKWASDLVDDELNPELHYVPCMTMQNIRVAFRDTLMGLLYLHYQGIIHRDIKPPNLLQTGDHRVKISDFGVSYLGRPVHEGEPGEEISESEAKDLDDEAKELAKTVGTPAFYAPELCITEHQDEPLPITKAIDVWALGITLYCMLFARTPYVDNEYVVMRQIADEEIYLPRRRLKPVEDKPKSRPNSRSRAYSPQTMDRRAEFDIVYEEIDDDLHDLLKRLLVKDPRQRIGLADVRHHPWVVADLPYSDKWLEETDQYVQSQGSEKIEVSKEDLNAAVVPLQFLERMRSGIKKIGDRLLSSTRGRSTSSANSASAPNSAPPSAHSSSSTISQDARRHSLRGEEISTLLKQQRESSSHPLAKSLAASPEVERANQEFFSGATHLGPFDDFGAALLQTMSHDSSARPPMAGRSKTGFSTAGSVRTIKQSDFPDQTIVESPPGSPGLPGTPRAVESPSSNLSGLLGGSHRSIFKTIRERTSAQSLERGRQQSVDSTVSSKDAHGEPSIAISDTVVAGRLAPPDLHSLDTAQSSASNSEQNSPTSVRPPMLPGASRPTLGTLSRHSSTASATSASARRAQDLTPGRILPRLPVSTDEERRRVEEQHVRRLLREVQEPPRSQSAFDDRTCPPSPDDVRSRQSSDARRISDFDISHPASYETSPTTPGAPVLPALVSSSSDFGSAVSMSISKSSIPSAISEASSLDRAEGPPLEEVENKHVVSSHDTITAQARPQIREEPVDEGYNPDEDTALDSDNGDTDSDSDSDGGLVMSRRKSATKSNNLTAALEASARKQRRGTGLSRSSKKSSRSGSNNTMKKVRTRDSIDERRRTSMES